MSLYRRNTPAEPMKEESAFIDASLFDEIKRCAAAGGVSQADVILAALKRGMEDYWLYVMADYREESKLIDGRFVQYRHDNELLKALDAQNRHFEKLLAEENEG